MGIIAFSLTESVFLRYCCNFSHVICVQGHTCWQMRRRMGASNPIEVFDHDARRPGREVYWIQVTIRPDSAMPARGGQ